MDDNQILALGRAGEDEATEFLLQKYGYLVKREVRTVYLIGAETEDLAQEGMIGLFKAIRDYSPDKAASFSTFASVCIRRQIQNAINSFSGSSSRLVERQRSRLTMHCSVSVGNYQGNKIAP